MSAEYTDEHLANITKHLKELEKVTHADAVNIYHLLAEQNKMLEKVQKSTARTSEVLLIFFWLCLFPIFIGFVLWGVYLVLH